MLLSCSIQYAGLRSSVSPKEAVAGGNQSGLKAVVIYNRWLTTQKESLQQQLKHTGQLHSQAT